MCALCVAELLECKDLVEGEAMRCLDWVGCNVLRHQTGLQKVARAVTIRVGRHICFVTSVLRDQAVDVFERLLRPFDPANLSMDWLRRDCQVVLTDTSP